MLFVAKLSSVADHHLRNQHDFIFSHTTSLKLDQFYLSSKSLKLEVMIYNK